ncbi:MAG: hypothetical protein AB1508_16240 [Pseudomonadota bacterium]
MIEDDGLRLGCGTVLVRMAVTRSGDACLAIDADQERLLALLSAAYARQMDPAVVKQIKRASAQWQRGEKASAHIELAFARLPRLRSNEDAFRLFLAEDLLAQGMTPRSLTLRLGFDPALLKYNPDEPRVPAGGGRQSGWWTRGGANQTTPDTRPGDETNRTHGGTEAFFGGVAVRTGVDSLLGPTAAETLEALALFASRFAVPTAVLGALFIPSPFEDIIAQGTLPDHPDVSYKLDRPEGLLTLTAKSRTGSDITIHAQNRDGVFVDVDTDTRIGRDFQGDLFLSWPAVQRAIQARTPANSKTGPNADHATDEPELCPAPVKDIPHGSSEAAKDYEDDVHLRVNPLAPIPRGFAVMFINPVTGQPVYFDDCFRYAGDLVDGDMHKGDLADAKGPRLEALLSAGPGIAKNVITKMETQAESQLEVADALGLRVKWYFAEKGAADYVRRQFERDGFERIIIAYMPPRRRR